VCNEKSRTRVCKKYMIKLLEKFKLGTMELGVVFLLYYSLLNLPLTHLLIFYTISNQKMTLRQVIVSPSFRISQNYQNYKFSRAYSLYLLEFIFSVVFCFFLFFWVQMKHNFNAGGENTTRQPLLLDWFSMVPH